MACNMVGLMGFRSITLLDRRWQNQNLILAFSLIFTLNIATGNLSLRYVSVNFNEVMRGLIPAIAIAIGLLLGKTISARRRLSVIPMVIGVAMACFGDMRYSPLGFFYTLCCVMFAALKVALSGEMITGPMRLHPVDLLVHMAPLAMVQCIMYSVLVGEVSEIVLPSKRNSVLP